MSQKKVLPPRGFRPAGVVEWVKYSPDPPPFIRNKRRYGRRAEGLRYEAKAHQHFEGLYGDYYIPSPWFIFKEVGVDKPRWCQPDALLLYPQEGKITLIECKLQHTSDAWWQLKWLYLPVIVKAFPHDLWDFSMCEVVKWYDPAVSFPEKVKLRPNVDETRPGEFGVHIWKP